MSQPPDVIAMAQALGQALAAHVTVRAHQGAQRAARDDAAAQKLLRDYQEQMAHMHQLEAEMKPVEVADKHRLRELESQMAGNDALKMLMRTQTDFVALMAQVNSAIDGPLSELHPPEAHA